MGSEYTPAPEVAAIARELIAEQHTHLAYARIEYVFIAEPATVRGAIVWGRAKKVTGLNAWLATPEDQREVEPAPFFVLEICLRIWDKLTDKAKRALVDHELCHFGFDEGKYTLMPHDLEEFVGIVQRHGLWRPEVEFFVEAGRQGRLFDLEKQTKAVLRDMDRAAEERQARTGYDRITMKVGDKEVDITNAITGERSKRSNA